MIMKGAKIKLVKVIEGFEKIQLGEEFEVTNVTDNNIIFKGRYGMGNMTHEEFNEFFKSVEKVKEVPVWTEWIGFACKGKKYLYRTDQTRIVVKDVDFNIGTAICHEDDEFNLELGLQLCVARLNKSKAENELKKANAELEIISKLM